MKTLLLLALILFSSSSFAQVWGRPGATWHYTKTVFGDGYITVKYIQDTLVDGHTCQQYKGTLYEFLQVNAEGDMQMFVSPVGKWHTYLDGNTVYYKSNGQSEQFEVMYDFDAQTGDQWYVNTSAASLMCNDTSTIEVLATGTMTVAGQAMPYKRIIDIDSSSVGFSSESGETTIVPRIGNIGSGFLFPIMGRNCDPGIIVDFYHYDFRCYEDDEIYYNPGNVYCEYFLNVPENEALAINVSPNPVSKVLSVNMKEGNSSYEILSVTGQQIAYGKFMLPGNQLDVSGFESGIYYLKVTDDQNNTGIIRFVKE